MFTGIVMAVGRLREAERLGGDTRLVIDTGRLSLVGAAIGDSIAVNGVCLTVTRLEEATFVAGGHYVSGHIDGVACVIARADDARSVRIEFELPPGLERYVARKGSICIDGVSLTVNEIGGRRLGVNLVPHTLAVTNAGDWRVGARVNCEVDMIARYLERLANPADRP